MIRLENLGANAKSVNLKSFAQSIWQQANESDEVVTPKIEEMTLTGEQPLSELRKHVKQLSTRMDSGESIQLTARGLRTF